MKKKLPIIISIIVIFYAVIFFIVILVTSFLPASVYDNQDMITKNFNSANKMNYRQNTHDGITTVSCRKMTGMENIWRYEADGDTIRQMYYNLNVVKGKAKLVLIQPDDTVITLTEQDGTENHQKSESDTNEKTDETASLDFTAELELKKGKNRIKIVCERGTKFSLSYKISE